MNILLKNAKVFTPDHPALEANVRVTGERISEVGRGLASREGEQVLDLAGFRLYPGFINAHVHAAFFTDEVFREFVRNGCTTLRDMAMMVEGDEAAVIGRMSSFRQDPGMPRMVFCGKFICTPSSYGSLHPDGRRHVSVEVSTPQEAEEVVNRYADLGCRGVKTALDDGSLLGLKNSLPPDEFFEAIFSAAKSRGLFVSAHITRSGNLEHFLEMGDEEVAHIPIDEMPKALIQMLKDRDLCVCTTLTMYEMLEKTTGQKLLEIALKNAGILSRAGVRLAVGNDMMEDNGFFEHGIPVREMQLLAEAGLPVNEIIRDATYEAARTCWIDDETGSIEAGKSADLIAVRGEPDKTFSCFNDIPLVINRGSLIVDRI